MIRFYLFIFMLGFHLVSSIWSQEDSLYSQVFKKKEQMANLVTLIGGSPSGEILYKIKNSENIHAVEKENFLNITKQILREDIFKKIKSESGEFLLRSSLEQLGITLTYKPDRLMVDINIPNDLRASKEVNLAFNRIPAWAQNAIHPSGVSGFVNFFNFYRDDDSQTNSSLTSDQNWNLNFGKLAFFAQTSWQRDQESRFIRQDTRFTYDSPEKLLRYQFGDLNYTVQDFQTFQPGAGVMVSTNFDLNPYRLFNPMTFREITLNTPSRVRVFINGVLVQTLNLPVGRHRLDNLPLNEGINTVRLEIQDNRGRLENVEFTGTTSFSLISKGFHDLTYGGGVPADEALQDRSYDTDDKKYFYVLNHLYGLSDQSNIGYGLMGNSKQRLLSLRSLYQGSLGVSNLNLSFSQVMRPIRGEAGEGVGGRFTHAFRDYQKEQRRLRTFDLGFEYLGPRFLAMDDLSPLAAAQYAPELGYTQFITDSINLRLRGLYRLNSKDSNSNVFNLSSALTLLYKRFYQFGLQYSYSRLGTGNSDSQFLFSFNWSLPSGGQIVTTSYNSATDETNGQWNYTGEGRPGNWRGLANYRKGQQQSTYEGEVGREDQRYAFNANFIKRDSKRGRDSQAKTLNLNTALAFAGGKISLSRPINQGFALINTDGALKRNSLYLNRNGDKYEAETGLLNSAVLPNYQAYRYYPVRIDARETPFGIKAPPSELVVAPPFRGGVLVNLESDVTKALIGKIIFGGRPLALKVGQLIKRDNNKAYPFFTNRKGRFLLEALAVGDYNILIEDQKIGEVSIKEEGENIQYWEYSK